MQNLDKIALGGAAFVIVASIAYALFGIGGAGGASDDIAKHDVSIQKSISNQKSVVPSPPEVEDEVRDTFSGFPTSAKFPEWSFYRQPAIAILEEPEVTVAPVHKRPRLIRLVPRRDKTERRVVVDLEVETPVVEHAEIESLTWEWNSGSGWQPGGAIDPSQPKVTVTVLEPFEPGSEVSFRVKSTAKSLSKQDFTEPEAEKTSTEVGPADIPLDRSIKFSNPSMRDLAADPPKSARVRLELKWYDYDGDKLETMGDYFDIHWKPSERMKPERELFVDKGVKTGLWLEALEEVDKGSGRKSYVLVIRDKINGKTLRIERSPKHEPLETTEVAGETSRAEEEAAEPDSDADSETTPDDSAPSDDGDEDSIFDQPGGGR